MKRRVARKANETVGSALPSLEQTDLLYDGGAAVCSHALGLYPWAVSKTQLFPLLSACSRHRENSASVHTLGLHLRHGL